MVANFLMWSVLVVLGVLVSLFPQHFLNCRLWPGLIGPQIPILLLGSGSDWFSLRCTFVACPLHVQSLNVSFWRCFCFHSKHSNFVLLFFYTQFIGIFPNVFLSTEDKALIGCPIYVFPSIQRTSFYVIFPLIMQSKRE